MPHLNPLTVFFTLFVLTHLSHAAIISHTSSYTILANVTVCGNVHVDGTIQNAAVSDSIESIKSKHIFELLEHFLHGSGIIHQVSTPDAFNPVRRSIFFRHQNRIFISGGAGSLDPDFSTLDDVYEIDQSSRQLIHRGTTDTPYMPSICAFDDHVVLFGGLWHTDLQSGVRDDDLFLFNLATFSWDQQSMTVSDSAAGPELMLAADTACDYDANQMFIMGGVGVYSGSGLVRMQQISLTSPTWTHSSHADLPRSVVNGFGIVVKETVFFRHGVNNGMPSDHILYAYQLDSSTLTEIVHPVPTFRDSYAHAQDGNTLFIVGASSSPQSIYRLDFFTDPTPGCTERELIVYGSEALNRMEGSALFVPSLLSGWGELWVLGGVDNMGEAVLKDVNVLLTTRGAA